MVHLLDNWYEFRHEPEFDLKVSKEWIFHELLEQRIQHLHIDPIHGLILTATILHKSMILEPFLYIYTFPCMVKS